MAILDRRDFLRNSLLASGRVTLPRRAKGILLFGEAGISVFIPRFATEAKSLYELQERSRKGVAKTESHIQLARGSANSPVSPCPRFTRGKRRPERRASQCKGMRNLLVRCLAVARCFGAFEVENATKELNGTGLAFSFWSLCHV